MNSAGKQHRQVGEGAEPAVADQEVSRSQQRVQQCMFGMLAAFLVAGGCRPTDSATEPGSGPAAVQSQPSQPAGTGEAANEPKGAGALTFHIIVDPDKVNPTELAQMRQRLAADGPKAAGNAVGSMRWFEIEPGHAKSIYGIAGKYNGNDYVLAWTTSDKSLDHRPGTPPWGLRDARPVSDQLGQTVVQFTFDAEGGKRFADFTRNNLKKAVATVFEGKVISAPIIESEIHETGTIDGGAEGFSEKELNQIIDTLNAGRGN